MRKHLALTYSFYFYLPSKRIVSRSEFKILYRP